MLRYNMNRFGNLLPAKNRNGSSVSEEAAGAGALRRHGIGALRNMRQLRYQSDGDSHRSSCSCGSRQQQQLPKTTTITTRRTPLFACAWLPLTRLCAKVRVNEPQRETAQLRACKTTLTCAQPVRFSKITPESVRPRLKINDVIKLSITSFIATAAAAAAPVVVIFPTSSQVPLNWRRRRRS